MSALVAPLKYRPRSEERFRTDLKDDLAKLGFQTWHTHDSRRSDEGWPDTVALRTDFLSLPDRAIFVELKIGSNRCTPAQWSTLLKLARFWEEVYVWTPRTIQDAYNAMCGLVVGEANPTHIHNLTRDAPPAPELGAWRAFLEGRIGGRHRAR